MTDVRFAGRATRKNPVSPDIQQPTAMVLRRVMVQVGGVTSSREPGFDFCVPSRLAKSLLPLTVTP